MQDRGTQEGMGLWPRQVEVAEQHPQDTRVFQCLGDSGVTAAEPWGLCQCGTGGWP